MHPRDSNSDSTTAPRHTGHSVSGRARGSSALANSSFPADQERERLAGGEVVRTTATTSPVSPVTRHLDGRLSLPVFSHQQRGGRPAIGLARELNAEAETVVNYNNDNNNDLRIRPREQQSVSNETPTKPRYFHVPYDNVDQPRPTTAATSTTVPTGQHYYQQQQRGHFDLHPRFHHQTGYLTGVEPAAQASSSSGLPSSFSSSTKPQTRQKLPRHQSTVAASNLHNQQGDEEDLDSLASDLVVARPITTDSFNYDDDDADNDSIEDTDKSLGQDHQTSLSIQKTRGQLAGRKKELGTASASPIDGDRPISNQQRSSPEQVDNWVSSLVLSRGVKPKTIAADEQSVEQQTWQFELEDEHLGEDDESLEIISPDLENKQHQHQHYISSDPRLVRSRSASRNTEPIRVASSSSSRRPESRGVVTDFGGDTSPTFSISFDNKQTNKTENDNDSLISHRKRKLRGRKRNSKGQQVDHKEHQFGFGNWRPRLGQSTASLPSGIFDDNTPDLWNVDDSTRSTSIINNNHKQLLLSPVEWNQSRGSWIDNYHFYGKNSRKPHNRQSRLLRSAFSSANSIFALYATRYAYEKYQLALRAFSQWYHENLTYHHLANRMEFNKQTFELWYNKRGRPLSLRALDHYDRVVIWIADERDAIQKKTFTRWINKYLSRRGKQIKDLFLDLRDGQGLISLLEMLSGQNLPRERGKMRVHNLQNIQIALNYIKLRKVKLVNIRPEDIADGNQKLTLGLIWTIILHFQLEDNSKFREILLRWAQKTTDGYPGCKVTDLTTSWRDGLAYNAIIHRNRPDLLDYLACRKKTSRDNLDQAFTVGERDLGVARLLEPEDVDVPCPDEKSMITYLAQLYELFPDPPERNPLLDAEMIRRIDEYKELASQLMKWIKDSTSRLDDRRFPKGIPELKKLKDDAERFRTQEVPPKQHDKQRLADVAGEIQRMAQDLRIKIPDDLHIDNIEYHWDRMMNALKNRNKALDDEINKAERLRAMLEKLLQDIKKANDRLDGVERQMAEEERRVSRLDNLKDAEAYSPAIFQKLSEELADIGIKIDSIKRLAEDFIQENGRTAPDSIMIREKVTDLDGRYKKLLAKLNRLHDEYDKILERLRIEDGENARRRAREEAERKLRLKLDAMKRQLDDLERRIDNMGPIAKDIETLQKQLAELNEFDKDLNKARHNLNDLIQFAEGLIADDLIADPVRLRGELQSLKDQLARIEEKAARRLRDFEAALKKAEDQKLAQAEIDLKLNGIKKELDELERRIDNMAPVGKDLATLQRQLNELRDFEQDVNKTRRNLNDVVLLAESMIRQDLIADPAKLRTNINGLKDQLARIDEKVARRMRAIQDGLNRAEAQKAAEAKYRLRLDAIKRELDDLERRLDNMEPVAKDLGKLQQQLEEMQDFNNALNKVRQNVNDVIKAGEDLIREDLIADPAELRKDMKGLKDHLARIEDKAAKRLRDIQDAMGRVAASDAIQNVAKWLAHAKKVLVNEENVHGDLDTVNALIEQHKSFQDELKSKQPEINEVRRMEKELSTASPETGAAVRRELQDLSNQWHDIEKLTREKTSKLESALEAAEQLHNSVHDLLEFAADAESKLRFAGAMPDDEASINADLANHEKLMRKMVSQGQAKDQTLKLAQSIQSKCHPDAEPVIKHWINIIQSRWEEIEAWAEQRGQKLLDYKKSLAELLKLVEDLVSWLSRHENRLLAEEAEQLPTNASQLDGLIDAHSTFMDDLRKREPDVDRVVKIFASKSANATSKMIVTTTTTKPRQQEGSSGRLSTSSGRLSSGARSTTPTRTSYATYRDEYPDVRQPRAKLMLDKWRQVWQLSLDKMQRLKDRVEHLNEIERLENFDFDQWRRRFLTWINTNKGRVMDFFRLIDDNNDGKIPIESFINGVVRSKFETSRLEMERVAEIFDKNNDGTIDNKEYLDSLRPDKPITDDEIIQDEVQRQVAICTCAQRYRVYHVGEGRYRFGESQKLRLVRILRSTVMVRVGGGWEPLTTFLQKNDPCRAKGRTNVELREQFILPEGASQTMATFRSKLTQDPGSMPVMGPITKIREKTDRSMPMYGHGSRFGSPSDYYSESESTSKTRSRIGRLTPGSTSSRPTSRSASRPTSRHGSDLA